MSPTRKQTTRPRRRRHCSPRPGARAGKSPQPPPSPRASRGPPTGNGSGTPRGDSASPASPWGELAAEEGEAGGEHLPREAATKMPPRPPTPFLPPTAAATPCLQNLPCARTRSSLRPWEPSPACEERGAPRRPATTRAARGAEEEGAGSTRPCCCTRTPLPTPNRVGRRLVSRCRRRRRFLSLRLLRLLLHRLLLRRSRRGPTRRRRWSRRKGGEGSRSPRPGPSRRRLCRLRPMQELGQNQRLLPPSQTRQNKSERKNKKNPARAPPPPRPPSHSPCSATSRCSPPRPRPSSGRAPRPCSPPRSTR